MQREFLEPGVPPSYDAELFNALMHLKRWCREEMHAYVTPPDKTKKLLQSEQDVSDMMEAYSEAIFEALFRSNQAPNTSTTDLQAKIDRANWLKDRFNLPASLKNNRLIEYSLSLIQRSFPSWIRAEYPQDGKENIRANWAALHMLLERRMATGFRLLYLHGEQWPDHLASWHLSRVVFDWSHTFTRAVFRDFRVSHREPFTQGQERPSSFCTALCAFETLEEKERFEATSGMVEGEYFYLWCGQSPDAPSDFREGDLVWFKNPGTFHEGVIQEHPDQTIGPDDQRDNLWCLLKKGLALGQLSKQEYNIDSYLPVRFAYTEELSRILDRAVAASSSNDRHWLARNSETARRLLDKDYTTRDCFWMIHSAMFYDWKYWYLFPSRFEGDPLGGLAISTESPMESDNLMQIALITNEMLGVLGEIEDWARRRLRRRRVRNLWNASKRVHKAWGDLVTKGKFNREEKVEQETLFRNILRVLFQPHPSHPFGDRNGNVEWGAKASHYADWPRAFDITSDKWKDWYERNKPLRMPNEKMQLTWNEHQRDNVMYAVVNYWNEARYNEGERGFAEWLKPSLGSEKALWDQLYNRYKALTAAGRSLDTPLFTFNDFLFDRARRKALLGWRGYSDQIISRGKESPIDWVSEPPFATHGVKKYLLIRRPDELDLEEFQKGRRTEAEIESYSREYLKVYVEELDAQVKTLRPCLRILIRDYAKRLEEYIGKAAQPASFDLYEGDVEYLRDILLPKLMEDVKADGEDDVSQFPESGDSVDLSARYHVAEYLIRTAIYLNTRMHIENEDILGFLRCAFLARTLIEHYIPTLYANGVEVSPGGTNLWHFYSIPIHIPLPPARTQKIQRTSILSLGTLGPLHDSELRVWREIGEQVVIPAIMIDLQNEAQKMGESLGAAVMRQRQLPIVVHSLRNKVKKPRTIVEEIYMNSALEPHKKSCWPLGEALKNAVDNSGVRDLPRLVSDLFISTQEAESQINLIDRIAKQCFEDEKPISREKDRIFLAPGQHRVSFASLILEQLQRALKEIPLSPQLRADYRLTAGMETAISELCLSTEMNDGSIGLALKRCLPNHVFRINLSAARQVFIEKHEGERLSLFQCWRQFCEDWASNLVIHGPKADESDRHVDICSSRSTGFLDLSIHSPIPSEERAGSRRSTGLGTTTMQWCAYCLSKLEFYSNGPSEDKKEWVTSILIPLGN